MVVPLGATHFAERLVNAWLRVADARTHTQVQSGAGRTGTWWGHEQFDGGAMKPDLLIFAKASGGRAHSAAAGEARQQSSEGASPVQQQPWTRRTRGAIAFRRQAFSTSKCGGVLSFTPGGAISGKEMMVCGPGAAFPQGIASGYPLAGLAGRDELFDNCPPGTLVSEGGREENATVLASASQVLGWPWQQRRAEEWEAGPVPCVRLRCTAGRVWRVVLGAVCTRQLKRARCGGVGRGCGVRWRGRRAGRTGATPWRAPPPWPPLT